MGSQTLEILKMWLEKVTSNLLQSSGWTRDLWRSCPTRISPSVYQCWSKAGSHHHSSWAIFKSDSETMGSSSIAEPGKSAAVSSGDSICPAGRFSKERSSPSVSLAKGRSSQWHVSREIGTPPGVPHKEGGRYKFLSCQGLSQVSPVSQVLLFWLLF